MQSAITAALIMYGLAAIISFLVACMIKLIYWTVNKMQRTEKKS